MKFRKKPIVVEAWQVPENPDHTGSMPPYWIVDAVLNRTIIPERSTGKNIIKTLEGNMTASAGDWIIQGVKGELYPCKPDIFEATYERALHSEHLY